MEKDLIKVLAQYFDENGKAKGGQEFFFRTDADLLLYADKECIKETIQEMIDIECKKYGGKHVYVDYEVVFSEPIELKSNFEDILSNKHTEKN